MVRAEAPGWINSRFEVAQQEGRAEFRIGGVPINEIAAAVNPPFYVYDAGIIQSQFEGLKRALDPHNINIYYSVKANTSLAVVNGLYQMGAGLEVASEGELLVAQRVEADPSHVSFAGPVKTDRELSIALDLGIGTINVESLREFERINALAAVRGIKQKVGIRVNPPYEVEGAGAHMGGGSKKFGFDEEQLTDGFVQRIRFLPNIDLQGVHVFAATQMLNTNAFLANIQHVCETAERLNASFPVRYVDFGGGLGIPYNTDQQQLPLDEISQRIGDTLKKFSFLQENSTALYVEPGRFLVGPSGIYVTRVDNVKESRGETMVLVDGGVHQMLRPAPQFGFGSHPIFNLSKAGEPIDRLVNVGGSLCTSVDFLGKKVMLTRTEPGDLIGVFNAGAYGWSESMPFFLSHGRPAEVLVGNGRFVVIREAVSPSEYLKGQILPPRGEIFSG